MPISNTHNILSPAKNALLTTTSIIDKLGRVATVAATAYICDDGIQISRPLSGPDEQIIKSELKDTLSLCSSVVSAIALATSILDLINAVVLHGTELNSKQVCGVAGMTVVASISAAISMSNFGVEHTTASSGFFAAGSVTLFTAAAALTTICAKENAVQNGSYFRLDLTATGNK